MDNLKIKYSLFLYNIFQIFIFSSVFLGGYFNALFNIKSNYLLLFLSLFLYFLLYLFKPSNFKININILYFYFLILFLNLLSFIPSSFTNGLNYSQSLIPLTYVFILSTIKGFNLDLLRKLYIMILYFSFLASILSFFDLNFLLPFDSEYINNFGVAQTGSIFGSNKTYGSFLLSFMLLFYERISIREFLILIISFILCGSRAPFLLFISLLFSKYISPLFRNELKLFLKTKFSIPKCTYKNISKFTFISISISSLIYLLYSNWETFVFTFNRIYSIISGGYFSSYNSGNVTRGIMFELHLDCFNNFSWLTKFFGNSGYCSQLIENGSENFYLDSLTNGGYFLSLIQIIVLILIFIKFPKKSFFIVCLAISAIFHRWVFDNYLGILLYLHFLMPYLFKRKKTHDLLK